MLLIPVMELKSGHSVYTKHHETGDVLVTEDPMEAAAAWVEAGAKRIHIVDVDSIRARQPVNAHKVAEMHRRYPDLEFQIGGISREEDILIWLDAGAKYLIMNSKAICREGFIAEMCMEYAGTIMVALDTHKGLVRFHGHEEKHSLINLVKEFEDDGVEGIVLTDIPDEGHVNGCNIPTCCGVATQIEIPVIANGGISSLEDLKVLEKADEHRLTGIMLGRVLHDKQLDFKKAQQCVADL